LNNNLVSTRKITHFSFDFKNHPNSKADARRKWVA